MQVHIHVYCNKFQDEKYFTHRITAKKTMKNNKLKYVIMPKQTYIVQLVSDIGSGTHNYSNVGR